MAEKMADRISVEEAIKLYALGYITVCGGGDIEIIKKEEA